jgi:hypothetical protein
MNGISFRVQCPYDLKISDRIILTDTELEMNIFKTDKGHAPEAHGKNPRVELGFDPVYGSGHHTFEGTFKVK